MGTANRYSHKLNGAEFRDLLKKRHGDGCLAIKAYDYLVKKSYSIRYGARNLRRTIQKDIEDKIAFKIVSSWVS